MNIYQTIAEKIRMNREIVSKEYAIFPTPDFNHRKKIETAVKENGGYCPCMIEKNDDTLCMCKQFRELNHAEFCHCQRYYKVLKAPTVCLCGSTKFKDKFMEAAREFTLRGYIVTMPMVFVHSDDEDINEVQKNYLDELHKAKIADADLIFVINQDGYIGKSTRNEIKWAAALNKKIEYLEN